MLVSIHEGSTSSSDPAAVMMEREPVVALASINNRSIIAPEYLINISGRRMTRDVRPMIGEIAACPGKNKSRARTKHRSFLLLLSYASGMICNYSFWEKCKKMLLVRRGYTSILYQERAVDTPQSYIRRGQ